MTVPKGPFIDANFGVNPPGLLPPVFFGGQFGPGAPNGGRPYIGTGGQIGSIKGTPINIGFINSIGSK